MASPTHLQSHVNCDLESFGVVRTTACVHLVYVKQRSLGTLRRVAVTLIKRREKARVESQLRSAVPYPSSRVYSRLYRTICVLHSINQGPAAASQMRDCMNMEPIAIVLAAWATWRRRKSFRAHTFVRPYLHLTCSDKARTSQGSRTLPSSRGSCTAPWPCACGTAPPCLGSPRG